ncbi:hypothetical protein SLEP1_g52566 [Rubroshorea leprosula]|uniref:Uncharacterized protein n=1 Tax=Rubroshorea leprosula TaxID=152421 RepID=A0AAV5M8F8_9ROSI|nr:hypothetical protein SLEP1_g52566 [Rubroshorea leprosula]
MREKTLPLCFLSAVVVVGDIEAALVAASVLGFAEDSEQCDWISSMDEMLVRRCVSGIPPRISQIGVDDGPGDGRCLTPVDYCHNPNLCDETQIWV